MGETFTPSEIINATGVVTSGDVNSLLFVADDNSYNLSEIIATPAFDVYFNFSANNNITYLNILAFYVGNPAHVVNVDIKNKVNYSWLTLGKIVDGTDWVWYNFTINDTDYSADGWVSVRIQHTSSGSAGHYLFIDYAEVEGNYSISDYYFLPAFLIISGMIFLIGVIAYDYPLKIMAGFLLLIVGFTTYTYGVYDITNTLVTNATSAILIAIGLYISLGYAVDWAQEGGVE